MDQVKLDLYCSCANLTPFLYVEGDGCHDGDNHEWNRGHDRKLEGDAFLHGVTLAQHRHILASSLPFLILGN
jgi:hypothetical protein